MNKIDMHCHTYYSKCSNLKPRDLLKTALKKKLSGLLICDHDTIEGVKYVKNEYVNKRYVKLYNEADANKIYKHDELYAKEAVERLKEYFKQSKANKRNELELLYNS